MGFNFMRKRQQGQDPLPAPTQLELMTNYEDTTPHTKRLKKQGFGHKARQLLDMYFVLRSSKSAESSSTSSQGSQRSARPRTLIQILQPRPPIPEMPSRRRTRDESRPRRPPPARADSTASQLVTIQHARRVPIGTSPPQFNSVMRVAAPRYETFARATHSTIIFASVPSPNPTEEVPELPPPTYSRFDGMPS